MTDVGLPCLVRPHYSNVRFEKLGVYEDDQIPKGSDDSPVNLMVCGVGDATVFCFAESKALYCMRLEGDSTDVSRVPIDYQPLGMYRAYASILVHLSSGDIIQYVLEDGALRKEGSSLLSVKDIRAPKVSFEVVTDEGSALFLFEATMNDGRVAQVFQHGSRIIMHKVEEEHQYFARDRADRLACFRLSSGVLTGGDGREVHLPEGSKILMITQDYALVLDEETLVARHFADGLRGADFTTPLPGIDAVYGHELMPLHQVAPALLTNTRTPVDTQRTQLLHLLINNGEDMCVFDLARVWDDASSGYFLRMLCTDGPAQLVSAYVAPMLSEGEMMPDLVRLNPYCASNMGQPYIPVGDLGVARLTQAAARDGIDLDLGQHGDTALERLEDEMPPNDAVRDDFAGRNYYYVLVTKAFEASAVSFHKLSTILLLRPDRVCLCNYSSYTCAAAERLCLNDECAKGVCPRIASVVSLPQLEPEPKMKEEQPQQQVKPVGFQQQMGFGFAKKAQTAPTLGIVTQKPPISFVEFMQQNERQEQKDPEVPQTVQTPQVPQDEPITQDASSVLLRQVRQEQLQLQEGMSLKMQAVRMHDAICLANISVQNVQRIQYMGQPFGTVILNEVDPANAVEYVRTGRVGAHVVHSLLGSRFGICNPSTGRIELLRDTPPRQALLDYGHACHPDALRCTLMPEELEK